MESRIKKPCGKSPVFYVLKETDCCFGFVSAQDVKSEQASCESMMERTALGLMEPHKLWKHKINPVEGLQILNCEPVGVYVLDVS